MSIKVDLKDFNRELGELKRRARNLEPPLRGFANYMEVETKRQFDFGIDPDGIPWKALKPQTLEQKRYLGFPDDILRRTKALENSFYIRVSSKSVVIGLSSKIAIYHQEGTEDLPQRKILGISKTRRQKGVSLIKIYILGRGR